MRIGVGIATVGRPELLRIAIKELEKQSRRPDRIIVCAPEAADVAGLEGAAEIIFGPRGSSHQRNQILRTDRESDVIVFFDDDFLPTPSYLAAIERLFLAHSDIVMATGTLIADGIIGPGIDIADAQVVLAADGGLQQEDAIIDVFNGYGCNFAVRLSAVRANRVLFDENLPLYAWLEDLDFSRQLARYGRIVKSLGARGIHLGIKKGRQSGVRLGYSQIANPLYLSRKGTCPWRKALRLIGRNVAVNCLRSIRPEPYVDRRGRVAGNIKAVADLLTGRLDPTRVLKL